MTKNNKNSNLTKEELDKIQNLVKSINQMQMQIGNFEDFLILPRSAFVLFLFLP